LDLLRPNTADRIEWKQSKQKELHVVGDTVLVRNHAPGEKWLPGTVATRESEVQYGVDLNCRTTKRCHVEEMRKQSVAVENPPEPSTESSVPEPTVIDLEPPSN